MPLITITNGSPSSEFDDGTYEMVLVSLTPKIITPKSGKQMGQEVPVLEWEFMDPEDDEIAIRATSSQVFTPKSKTVEWIGALLGPEAARLGASFDEKDLIGRKALVTIKTEEGGWPKVTALGALPTRRSARVAATTPAVASTEGEQTLPF